MQEMWQEPWVQFLGWEDCLEEGMAMDSTIFTWKIPWIEEPDRLQSMESQWVRHDLVTTKYFIFKILNISKGTSTCTLKWRNNEKYFKQLQKLNQSLKNTHAKVYRYFHCRIHSIIKQIKKLLRHIFQKPYLKAKQRAQFRPFLSFFLSFFFFFKLFSLIWSLLF